MWQSNDVAPSRSMIPQNTHTHLNNDLQASIFCV